MGSVTINFREAGGIAASYRRAGAHRFEAGQAEAFHKAREDVAGGVLVEPGKVGVADEAGE